MEDLQEEIKKLVDDGGRIGEDQANMVKVAACLLAAKVSCRTGEEDGSPFAFRFAYHLPFGGMSTAWQKTRNNGNVTVDCV